MISLWQEVKMPEFPSLEGDIKTDVLIIGGGIAGVLTAYYLHQKGVSYILAEKDRICQKVSANTTAKITAQHGLIYSKLLKNFGLEKAQMYYSANKQALDEYFRLCSDIDCDFEEKENYVYLTRRSSPLEEELRACEKIGAACHFAGDLPLPLETQGAVCFSRQAQFHPLKFLSHIAEGLNIYENTFIEKLSKGAAVYSKGTISTEKIIVTTHFPFIDRHGSYFLKLYQDRSYVIALKGAPNINGMYVDGEKTGLSFRNHEDLLLFGGASHRTGKESGAFEELRRIAKEKFPDSHEKYHFATQDCMSLDGVPYIGKYSACTDWLYTATGFNKWGMTSSMAAAFILCGEILGEKCDFAPVFSPSRSILKPQLAINGGEAIKNLLSFTKKRCPHMGCALKWNKAERTWDCPCHGSRFSRNGEILDNPANQKLKH